MTFNHKVKEFAAALSVLCGFFLTAKDAKLCKMDQYPLPRLLETLTKFHYLVCSRS